MMFLVSALTAATAAATTAAAAAPPAPDPVNRYAFVFAAYGAVLTLILVYTVVLAVRVRRLDRAGGGSSEDGGPGGGGGKA